MNDQNKVKSNATASTSNVNNSALSELDLSALCDESVLELLDEPFELNTSTLRHDYKYKGFDPSLGHTWIYPTNLPLRQYQFNISRAALFKNTLVSLIIDRITSICPLTNIFLFSFRLFCPPVWAKRS